jgi:hypothetical protein
MWIMSAKEVAESVVVKAVQIVNLNIVLVRPAAKL